MSILMTKVALLPISISYHFFGLSGVGSSRSSKFGSESRGASAEGGGLSIGWPSRLFLPSHAVSENTSKVKAMTKYLIM